MNRLFSSFYQIYSSTHYYVPYVHFVRKTKPAVVFLVFSSSRKFRAIEKEEGKSLFFVSRDAAQERGGNRSVCSPMNDYCCDLNSALRFNYTHDMMPIVYPWIGLTYLNHGQYIFTRFIQRYHISLV